MKARCRRGVLIYSVVLIAQLLPGAEIPFTYHRINGGPTDASSVAYADIDRDGNVDVIVSAAADDAVYWFRNDGAPEDGDFYRYTISSSAFEQAWYVHAADVNGDGWTDVVGAARGGTDALWDVVWWENDGSLSGWEEHGITVSWDGARTVSTVDMDSDGDLDVLLTAIEDTSTSDVMWMENPGIDDGYWFGTRINELGLQPLGFYAAAAGDLDRDGDIDVVATALYGDDVIWFRNDGTPIGGGWDYFYVNQLPQVIDGAAGVVLGDMDMDGDDDVIVTAYDGDDVYWFENDIAATTSGWTRSTVINSTMDGPLGVQVADMDSDGDLDLVMAADQADTISWLENFGDGVFFFTHNVATGFDGARSVRVTDLDSDGDLDVIGAGMTGDLIGWWENRAGHDGAYFNRTPSTAIYSRDPRAVVPAKIDADGHMDFAVANSNADNTVSTGADIIVFLTEGRGATGWLSETVDVTFNSARSVTTADLDGDGDVDLIGAGGSTVAWWAATASGWTRHDVTTTCTGAQSVSTIDFDSDGDLDVIAACSGIPHVRICLSDGTPANGGWSFHMPSPSYTSASSVVAADISRDGMPDLVVADGADVLVEVHEGSFSFTRKSLTVGLVGSSNPLAVADFDRDGDPDIVTADSAQGSLVYLRQPATGWMGTWSDSGLLLPAAGHSGMCLADLDFDGALEATLTSPAALTVATQEIIPGGPYNPIATGAQDPASPQVADLDHDGDLDIIAVAGGTSDDILIFWNEPALFADDFELGTTGRWSAVEP